MFYVNYISIGVAATLQTGLHSLGCVPCSALSATRSKANMAEIEEFDKLKLKEREIQEKNPLPSTETIE